MRRVLYLVYISLLVSLPLRLLAIDLENIVSSAVTAVKMTAEASKDISAAEEYYIGRGVAANVISRYPLVKNPSLTQYVNKVGLAVAAMSKAPVTYGGYHFGVISSTVENAYACPGGFIFITTGLLKKLKSEDELAMILGHEIAHVVNRDSVKSLQAAKWRNLGYFVVGEATSHIPISNANVSELVGVLKDTIMDVSRRVIDAGYSQSDEKKADLDGLNYAAAAGYSSQAAVDFFKRQIESGASYSSGPFSSHPSMKSRLQAVEKAIPKLASASISPERTSRFKSILALVR